MKSTKLIIVSGMSGSGKSTTSKEIARLYAANGIERTWYHEEIGVHPIRGVDGAEFNVGDIKTEEGMQLNIKDNYSRWEKFIGDITAAGGVHIMEGCLYQNIVRYFFPGGYPEAKILEYYDQLMSILERADTHIIYLASTNVRGTLEKAFNTRGDRWKSIILEAGDDEYYKIYGYNGDESVYKMWNHCRRLSEDAFNLFCGKKLKVEVDPHVDQWPQHMQKIADFLRIEYLKQSEFKQEDNSRYCGTLYDAEGKKRTLRVFEEDGQLYFSTSWFNYMQMVSTGPETFELTAFPISLTYSFADSQTKVIIGGNYGWDINGHVFTVVS